MSRNFLLLLSLPLLAACRQDDFAAPGTWQPTGANEANLREMIANPNDLSTGEAAKDTRGQVAAVAVKRLLDDKARPLSGTSTSAVGNVQAPAAAANAPSGQ